jgi:polyadenylate-binding protein
MAATQVFTSASLYVGDLKPDVTESLLFDVFKQCGTVASIRVCRDAVTRRSLCYAYVNFHTTKEAESALDTLNFSQIAGKPCRICWSIRDPSKRKSGAGNVFVKGLEATVNNQQLLDTFSTFGNIISCKVATDETGASKGYGYVHFEKEESARAAVEQVNGKMLAGKIVTVTHFVPRRDRAGHPSSLEQRYTNVYIKGLDPTLLEEKVKEEFSKFGNITSAKLMRDSAGASRCFMFANFETHASAQAAVEQMNNSTPAWNNGKALYAARAQKRAERDRELRSMFERLKAENDAKHLGVNLYIRNLVDSISDEELRNIFISFGTITSAKVMKDEKGNSKGFGFVCFSTSEEAIKALSEMNGSIVHQKPLYVALAQKKEQRQQQLRQMHRQYEHAAAYMQAPPPMWYPHLPQRMPLQYGPPPQMMRWAQGPTPPRVPYGFKPQGTVPQGAGMTSGGGPAQGQHGQMSAHPQAQGQMVQGPVGGQYGRGPRQGVPQQAQGMRQQPRGPAPMVGGQPQRVLNSRRPVQAPYMVVQQPVPMGVVPVPLPSQPVSPPAAAPAPASASASTPVAAPAPAPAAPAQPAVQLVEPNALSVAEFDSFMQSNGQEELKQTLGERLFVHVMAYQPEAKCGKITGMLLESLTMPDLNSLLGEPAALRQKIEEANVVYEQHAAAQAQAQQAQMEGQM